MDYVVATFENMTCFAALQADRTSQFYQNYQELESSSCEILFEFFKR